MRNDPTYCACLINLNQLLIINDIYLCKTYFMHLFAANIYENFRFLPIIIFFFDQTAEEAMTPIESTFSLDVNSKLDW